MRSVAIASIAFLAVGIAGCSQTASNSGTSASPSASQTSTASDSPSPTATVSKSSSGSTSTKTAKQVATSLGCLDISEQTPAGTKPVASTMVRCNLAGRGYLVLAYTSPSSTTAAVASLQAQASGSGETMTIAKATTWIVKAAEGPTVGAPMLSAAARQGGQKVVLG